MQLIHRPGGEYTLITDDTATQCKTGAGVLKYIQINAALTGTIKVIDNTSGTTANIGTITNPAVGDRYFAGLDFTAGLRIIASGSCNITVVYD